MRLNGTLVVNHYLSGEKYAEQHALYEQAAAEQDIRLQVRTNAQYIERDADFVLFLDKDVILARQLELDGMRVFNSAEAIALCDDKALTYLRLRDSGLLLPETLPVPMTFFASDWADNPFVERAADTLGFPMIVKETHGSFGKQVWLAQNRNELVGLLNAHSPNGMLLQKFIASSVGRDVRVNVVGDQAVASMYRFSETDFRANVSAGGKMRRYEPNAEQIAAALTACRALGLDFGGVDLLFGKDDEPILCEVNSNAHIKNLLDCTGVNVAAAILAHIRTVLERDRS